MLNRRKVRTIIESRSLTRENKSIDVFARRINSAKTRCSAILMNCTKVSACFATIKTMKRNGARKEKKIRLATVLFNKKKIDHTCEDTGPKFKFIECWEILKEFPKLAATEHKLTQETSKSEMKFGSVDYSPYLDEIRRRQEGIKEQKEMQDGRLTYSSTESAHKEHRSKKLYMTSDMLELQKRHIKELERHKNIQLFPQGPWGSELDMVKELFVMKQKERFDCMKAKDWAIVKTDGIRMFAAVVVDDEFKE